MFALQVDMASPNGLGAHPLRATPGSFGYDLSLSEAITIEPGTVGIGKTSLVLARNLPMNEAFTERENAHLGNQEGLAMLILPRSSLALRYGLLIPNSPGLIDADYTGEIGILLHNFRTEPVTVPEGARVAQALFVKIALPFVVMNLSSPTDRAERGGFGSTGR